MMFGNKIFDFLIIDEFIFEVHYAVDVYLTYIAVTHIFYKNKVYKNPQPDFNNF